MNRLQRIRDHLELMKKKNTYKFYITCANCLQDIHIDIPKGTPSLGFIGKCPKCERGIKIGKAEERAIGEPTENALRVAKILMEAEAMEWTITLEEAAGAVKFLQRVGLLDGGEG